jgi:hypothetical protein
MIGAARSGISTSEAAVICLSPDKTLLTGADDARPGAIMYCVSPAYRAYEISMNTYASDTGGVDRRARTPRVRP